MDLGLQKALIVDYGMIRNKAGSIQIFIDFMLRDRNEQRWYGFPLKMSGDLNEMVMAQLVYAGFDLNRDLNCIALGLESGCFTTYKEIDIFVKDVTQTNGTTKRAIYSIGPKIFGKTNRVSIEEAATLFTDEQLAMFKGAAFKFASIKVENPNDEVPL